MVATRPLTQNVMRNTVARLPQRPATLHLPAPARAAHRLVSHGDKEVATLSRAVTSEATPTAAIPTVVNMAVPRAQQLRAAAGVVAPLTRHPVVALHPSLSQLVALAAHRVHHLPVHPVTLATLLQPRLLAVAGRI